jgi:hypothetical protein
LRDKPQKWVKPSRSKTFDGARACRSALRDDDAADPIGRTTWLSAWEGPEHALEASCEREQVSRDSGVERADRVSEIDGAGYFVQFSISKCAPDS